MKVVSQPMSRRQRHYRHAINTLLPLPLSCCRRLAIVCALSFVHHTCNYIDEAHHDSPPLSYSVHSRCRYACTSSVLSSTGRTMARIHTEAVHTQSPVGGGGMVWPAAASHASPCRCAAAAAAERAAGWWAAALQCCDASHEGNALRKLLRESSCKRRPDIVPPRESPVTLQF
jgi:hypothetical protein